ncbi:jg15695 [Pararge aegeria aegeria]|uniref:RNA polymerase II subunit B1 CTD phosphatase RPAP2 homolog n=2 Tax=Pararge aegeria TaxID=116150 RepID=A0A8S4SFK0_9NEOP|nr:jg15695 [Pararge aegeria aegeria]
MNTQANRPTKRPTKVEELTKEQIRQAIIKKHECNAKAQIIVESLLEKDIQQDYFLKCLTDINQTHFDDVIEERSILHLCGYPICRKTLSEKDIPKQKYRISMKTNKVYDITARKSFCSNICYKAAMHVKKQMLTSPLWFRDYEKIPELDLLPLNSAGSMGQELDLSLTEKIVSTSDHRIFTSIKDFTDATLNDIDKYQNNKNSSNKKNNINKQSSNMENRNDVSKETKDDEENTGKCDSSIEKTINDILNNPTTNSDKTAEQKTVHKESISPTKTINNPLNILSNVKCADEKTMEMLQTNTTCSDITGNKQSISAKKTTSNPLNIVGDIIERPVKPTDPILANIPSETNKTEIKTNKNNNKPPQKKQISIAAIKIEVEKCLAEWFTIDTLLFLFGQEKVKEMVADKGECIQEYLNNYSKHIECSSNTYDQYQALCRKLNMLEIEERRFDSQTSARESKPLPDYNILKEESKKMHLKVKAFFTGETEIPTPNEITDVTLSNDDENKTQLPLVDKNAQNTLRRRIVCKHLNKVLPDLLRSLGLLSLTKSSDIRLLVNTFKLKANNIMFKPIQWTLIAMVFIQLLALRDGRLKYLLEQPMAFQHMQLLLLSYKLEGGYLERLISWLTDIDRLLDVNDTQLTIE